MSNLTPVEVRFFSKVDADGPCWEWVAARMKNGYGVFNRGKGRGTALAHRFCYETLVGPIPAGMQMDHLCRVRHCVNPDHLDLVTQRENLRRGYGNSAMNARKATCAKGHPFDGSTRRAKGRVERICSTCKDTAYQPTLDDRRRPSRDRLPNQPARKLTWETADAIRDEHASGGVMQVELAKKYGVSTRLIRSVIRNEAWKESV